jgi:hypothetical protein
MALKFRRGTTAQQSGSLAFGEPFVNTTLGTLLVGGDTGDITLAVAGTGSTGTFGPISGSGLDITGNANIAGNLTLGGTITIGDAATDNVVVNADLSSSIIPNNDNAFDLGSSAARYRAIYGTNIYGAINATNGVVSGSSQVTLQSTTGFSAYDTTLATITGSLISSASADRVSITNINSATASLIVETTNLETFSASALTRLSALEVETSNLETFSGSQLTQNSNLATITGSLISSASTAKTTNDSQGVSITNLNTYTSSLQAGIQMTGSTVSFLGNIVVYGTQSIINSTNLAINDNLIYLNEGSSITNPDLGIVGNYNDGVYAHSGIFRDASDGGAWKVFEGYTSEPSGTIDTSGNGFALADFKADVITATSFNGTINSTNGVVSGSSQVNADTITNFDSNVLAYNNSLGVISGSSQVSLGSASGNIALSTQTTGDYVASLVAGTNITLSNNSGEGATPTIGLTNNAITIAGQSTSLGGTVTADTIRIAIGTVVTGSAQIQLGSASGNIALSTQTTGDYVASLVAGTGVTLSNNSGEGATPTVAIGQSVATNATPTFGNLTINGTITATGDITAYYTSDKRHKNNIQTISNAVLKVKQLNGVTWEWNDDVNEVTKSTPKTGLIAQEVQQVLPQVVTERNDGFLALDYSKMVGLLVEAIKEQQIQIDQLKAQIGSK